MSCRWTTCRCTSRPTAADQTTHSEHTHIHTHTYCIGRWRRPKSNDWRAATSVECRCSCGQQYTQVRPRLVATLTHQTTLAQCTGAGRVQARPLGVQLSAQPSTPVPRRPLPVCLQCCLQSTSSLCQPRSSRRASASLSSYGRRAFTVAGPATWNWLPDSLRDPAISRDFFRRSLKTFLFSAYSCAQHIRAFWTMHSTN